MLKNTASYGALVLYLLVLAQAKPISSSNAPATSIMHAREFDAWRDTLSNDTRHRLDVAHQHLDGDSAASEAFRNDTMMRINIEREALDLSLIDLGEAFGMTLPASRAAVAGKSVSKRNNAGYEREQQYLQSGTMYTIVARDAGTKRNNAGDEREQQYLQSGTMYTIVARDAGTKRNNAGDEREQQYLQSGTMYTIVARDADAKRNNDVNGDLLNGDNLALGALERINIAHRVLGQPEITKQQADEIASHGDEYVSGYWSSSLKHGNFWTTDQAAGKPNFIEGGQLNGFGFTQSTFHKLHCLANLRMMLSWHITGNGGNMSRDMNVHAIHCLEYIHARELANPDLNEEPIDTVDYKGMGIH